METKVTLTELADELLDVLDRVNEKRERFIAQRDGVPNAEIVPPKRPPGTTVDELIARVGNLKVPEGLAVELEAIQAEQGLAEFPEWPD